MGNLIRAEWRRFKRDPFLWGIAAVGVAYGCYLARGTWGAELPREINSGDQTVPGAVWLLWQLPGCGEDPGGDAGICLLPGFPLLSCQWEDIGGRYCISCLSPTIVICSPILTRCPVVYGMCPHRQTGDAGGFDGFPGGGVCAVPPGGFEINGM